MRARYAIRTLFLIGLLGIATLAGPAHSRFAHAAAAKPTAAAAKPAAQAQTTARPAAQADAPKEAEGETKSIPTKVTSERMVYEANKQTVVFSGNVKVTRPDFTMNSALLTIYLARDKAAPATDGMAGMGLDAGKIDRMVAEKNVRMTMEGDRHGQCETATYTMNDGKIVMEGSPILTEGPTNRIAAQKIIFYTREGRTEFDKTIDATFVTQEKADGSGKFPSVKP